MSRLWRHAKSVASIVVITVNLFFWCVPLLVLALAKLAIPSLRDRATTWMAGLYRAAVRVDDWWLGRVMGIEWDRPPIPLDRERSYIVLSNHTSWSDILLIQSVIARDGPLLKFLVKRELLAVPIVGLVIWAFDFPILRRRSRGGGDDAERRQADLETLREACRVVRRNPAAMMNFVEGTRFTTAKHAAQGSAYRNLLVPRAGGFSTLLEGLEGEIAGVVDLTLIYPESQSFWRFLAGDMDPIRVEAETFPVEKLPSSREEAKRWLAWLWTRKDARIEAALHGPSAAGGSN